MQNERFYFTLDGSYGIVDNEFTIINTSDFTSEHWDEIEKAPDNMKMDYAMAYRDLLDANKNVEPGQWIHLEENIEYLLDYVRRNLIAEDEVIDVLVQIKEGLGL
jgi:hypothetical protein